MSKTFGDKLADALEESLRGVVPERLHQEILSMSKGLEKDELFALNVLGFGLGYLASRLRRRLGDAEAEPMLVKAVAQQLQIVMLTSEPSGDEEPPPNES